MPSATERLDVLRIACVLGDGQEDREGMRVEFYLRYLQPGRPQFVGFLITVALYTKHG